ncbi:MAG: hypothetical protein ABI432_13965 [Flavobacteriales bacterium]
MFKPLDGMNTEAQVGRRCMVVFCSHGISDPLVSSLMLDYALRMQVEALDRDILLFTEEPPGALVPSGLEEQLGAARIAWVPLRYDVKGAQWTQKGRSLFTMLRHTRAFTKRYRHRWLVGFLSYGGGYAMLFRMLGMGPVASVCFEPHSRYMIELGIWRRRSAKALFMGWLERYQMHRANVLVVPTTAVRDLVMNAGPRGTVHLQGITIDVDQARFDAAARETFRDRYKLHGTTVLAYVGKFGGIYYSVADYMRFVATVCAVDHSLRFLVISASDQLDAIRADPRYAELAERMVLHGPVPSKDLPALLSGADLGVISVPPTPSQAYRTPVKTAHYWAAGLPLIIPEGVSDDWRIARDERVGIVVSGLLDLDLAAFQGALEAFRTENREEVRARCLNVARRFRDSGAMVQLLNEVLR